MTSKELVRGLDDLKRGPEIQGLLIAMGPAAIEALTRFLLGPPSLHAQPRMLAAEALGAIGGPRAVAALVAALHHADLAALPLGIRLSEEAVLSCVARELGRLGDRSATPPLLQALRRFHLVEAGRALLGFGDTRAVPFLVECLDDAFIRERAADVLRQFREAAVDALIGGLQRREPSEDAEARWNVERRAACGRLLGEIGNHRAEPALRASLTAEAGEVRVAASLALARLEREAAPEVVAALVEGLASDDPSVVADCGEALTWLGPSAVPAVVAALTSEASRVEARGELTPGRPLRAMARTLGQMREPGARALSWLARHRSPLVRGLAVAHIHSTSPLLVKRVVWAALTDPDMRVRNTAAARLRALEAVSHG